MKDYNYVIVGGGLAGGSAVDAIRQVDAQGSLALVTQEPHRPYHRSPLSKGFLMGQAGREKVYLRPKPGRPNPNSCTRWRSRCMIRYYRATSSSDRKNLRSQGAEVLQSLVAQRSVVLYRHSRPPVRRIPQGHAPTDPARPTRQPCGAYTPGRGAGPAP
jgi:hypothetical protein